MDCLINYYFLFYLCYEFSYLYKISLYCIILYYSAKEKIIYLMQLRIKGLIILHEAN